MIVKVVMIGRREFLRCGECCLLPIDKIERINYGDDEVKILMDDAEDATFTNENALALKEFFA